MNKPSKPVLHPHDLEALIKAAPTGVIQRQQLQYHWRDVNRAIQQANQKKKIGAYNQFIYDPTRLTREAVMDHLAAGGEVGPPDFGQLVLQALQTGPERALPAQEIVKRVGDFFSMDLLREDELTALGIQSLELALFQPFTDWYFLSNGDPDASYLYAFAEAEKRHNAAWQAVEDWAGPFLREGAPEGQTPRSRALARLYSRAQMEAAIALSPRVLKVANKYELLERITCPDGAKRMRASDVLRLRDDAVFRQSLEDEVEINIWQVRAMTDLKINFLRTFFERAGVKTKGRTRRDDPFASVWYRWGDVRPLLWPEGDHPSVADIELIEETNGAGREAWWSQRIQDIHREIAENRRREREAKDQKKRAEREQREALRNQMLDNFPQWLREEDAEQFATIHVGPTNSGKTHDAILELVQAGSGWYLAPLRLLAREMFERINRMGVLCNFITGEERIDLPGAQITAATVEMFNPEDNVDCVVLDEAHMIADNERGWAWTRVIMNTRAPNLQIITAPHGLELLSRFVDSMGVEKRVVEHQRLVPLSLAERHYPLEEIPPQSIVIAFTRRDVLHLKYILQRAGRAVSVVYGALPPEVRLKQAHRFAFGEAEICVATDAVGMGLNLPADYVIFTDMTKFDGRSNRRLLASEIQQIAGRAGRFGMAEQGWVSAIDKQMMEIVRKAMGQRIPEEKFARLAPRTDEIELLEGDLAQRLLQWQQLNAVPDVLRTLVKSTEMEDRLDLANHLSYDNLMVLGIERALTLINAPARKESRDYWVECANAIIQEQILPLPPPPPTTIHEGGLLKEAERVIACMDVYLWLGYRQPFRHLVTDRDGIMHQRDGLTREIDLALLRKFDPNTRGNRYRRSDTWYDE
jgi:ATP-dependent RNA helicase SUPV3L1/SUV3